MNNSNGKNHHTGTPDAILDNSLRDYFKQKQDELAREIRTREQSLWEKQMKALPQTSLLHSVRRRTRAVDRPLQTASRGLTDKGMVRGKWQEILLGAAAAGILVFLSVSEPGSPRLSQIVRPGLETIYADINRTVDSGEAQMNYTELRSSFFRQGMVPSGSRK